MTETVIYFTPIVRLLNFSCPKLSFQELNSHFAVGNSQPARQFITKKATLLGGLNGGGGGRHVV